MIARPTLADSLDLVVPWLDSELVDPETLAKLRLVAELLPPVARAGFECRLDPDARQVDLQQGISSGNGELAVLQAVLDAANQAERHPGWAAVQRVCSACQIPDSPLAKGVSELWLEVDFPGGSVDQVYHLAPSIFVRLRPASAGQGGSGALAREVIGVLGSGPGQAPAFAALTACADACPEGAWISHVGAMLGRTAGGFRIHVSGLRLDRMERFLEQVGWPGDGSSIRRLAGELFEIVDSIIVCLDIGERIGPLIGFECVFSLPRETDPRVGRLLDYLISQHLCSPAKRDALLRWPGRISPPETALPWPDHLLILGLQQPAQRLGFLERRWSHIKLTCDPGGPRLAKAYFGFHHGWSVAGEPAQRSAPPRPQRRAFGAAPVARPVEAHLPEASHKAVGYLEDLRSQSGLWREFFTGAPRGMPGRTLYQASDEWVSAYVGWALANCSEQRARVIADEVWNLLLARRLAESGWGYNARILPDADSTLGTLRFARALGLAGSNRLTAAREFVLTHECADGGIACYRIEDSARLSLDYGVPGPWDGWCAPSVSISAAAVTLSVGTRTLNYLLARQRSDGSWTDYWWEDDEVTTALAIEGLLARSRPECQRAIVKAVRWMSERIQPEAGSLGSAFATALRIQGLARTRKAGYRTPDLLPALRWLLELQQPDGGFPASARLLAPPQDQLDRHVSPATVVSSLDHDAIYTTATALAAFNAVQDSLQAE
ncbi:MAG: hypothetical protein ACT4PM_10190 [Gemmatimonadales bacterium]